MHERHKRKFLDFILKKIEPMVRPQILEFGVSDDAMSTSFFLELCEKDLGKLVSVDINDYGKKFSSPNWKFIHARDDNFDLIDKDLKLPLDIIYLDTIHKADHVKKIIYHYYKKLKVNGYFFIDDISWINYAKNKKKNHFHMELNNMETFEKILDIYNANIKNLDLEFSFVGTGIAKIKKISDDELNQPIKIKSRKFTIKNFFRKIYLLLVSK